MFGFGKSKNNQKADLFYQLLRGRGDETPGITAQTSFPHPDTIASDPTLAFDIKNNDGKIFLGTVNPMMQDHHGISVAQDGHLVGIQDDRHCMIVAGNRAGKGRSLLLPILASWPGSVIVIDPKLDLATQTSDLRSRYQKVQIIDPFEVGGQNCDSYRTSGNPMSYRLGDDEDDLMNLATLIADGLIVRGKSSDSHWDESARMFLEAVILHVMTYLKYKEMCHLTTVHELLMIAVEDGDEDKGQPSSLALEMAENTAAGGAVINGMASYYDKEERERSGVLSTLRRHLHFLGYPKIRRALSDGQVDLRTLHDQPTSLYLGLPATKIRSCAGLPRLFLNVAMAAFEASQARRDFQFQSGRYPCLMIVDEAFALGPLESMEVAAGLMAGFGIKLLTVFQDLSQLKALYPKSWETFAANCGLMSFFGNQDLATLEYIEKRLGKTKVINTSRSGQTYEAAIKGGASGMSRSESDHPLLSVAELARVFNRDDPMCRQLVLSARYGPMLLHRIYYDQHKAFKGLFDATT